MNGGIEDALVPFLTGNNNPAPSLPPSSGGEAHVLLLQQEQEVHNLMEVPEVPEEDIWAEVDAQEEPLIDDQTRRELLADRMRSKRFNPETQHNEPILMEQVRFEKNVEKHLRRFGYSDKDILRELPNIRIRLLYTNSGKK